MDYKNYDDIVSQMEAGGLVLGSVKSAKGGVSVGHLVVDSDSPVRCNTEDDSHEKRGWYWLSSIDLAANDGGLDRYIVGAFGVYRGNDNSKQNLRLNRSGGQSMTPAEKEAMRTRLADQAKRAKAARAAEAKRAAERADRAWRAYLPTGESDYLKRKGVKAYGLRFSPSGNGTVAIPMLRDGRVVGLQLIRGKDRGKKLEKQYWPAGIDKVGAYHLIGASPAGVVLVAEGYATAATLHEATGYPVAVAFDAGSIMPVVAAIAVRYRGVKILICADDDYLTPNNPGVEAARLAAAAHGAQWIKPEFSEERPTTHKGPTDFNDLQQAEGLHVVREQLTSRLDSLGWVAARTRGVATRGEGEIPERSTLSGLISVGEACERFALVYGGKGTLFDHQEHMLVPKSDVLDILPDHGWREWKLREDRQVVRLSEVGFDPACTDKTIKCNLWSGWPTQPKEGDADPLLALLNMLIVGEKNAPELFRWVLKWLAYPIQHPGAKMQTALVFHGLQGTGKNLFFEAIMAIYGEYGRIVDQAAIEDKFNDWASRKLFLIADEVVARQELFHVKNKLKHFVTGEWIRINPKNVAAHDEKNHCNIVYLSNEIQPLVLEKDDRRHFVIWCGEKESPDFYREVGQAVKKGNAVAALHHYLLNLDLGDFDEHSKPPMTDAKRELIGVSAGNVQRFIDAWKAGDVILGDKPLPLCPCGSSDLYTAYTRWCRQEGIRNPREANQFGGEISKLPGWWKGLKDRLENLHDPRSGKRWRFVIPSAEAMNDAAAAGRDYRQKEGQAEKQWVSESYFAFLGAMGDEK